MDKKYILVVDDDPDLVETVAMMLESKGCEVGQAYDGVEGEESIKERRPDLVILDIMMPRKDGYVLCAEMKANEKTPGYSRWCFLLPWVKRFPRPPTPMQMACPLRQTIILPSRLTPKVCGRW